MEKEEDKKLYQDFLQGNKASFEELVLKYKNQLIYFLQSYVKNIDTAEDLAQDVFVYILIHRTNYDFKYSMKTYLYTIGKSKALNYLKREKKITYTDELEIREIEELEESIIKTERTKNLMQDIKKLKKDYQSAIYLADIEELSYKEIRGNIKQE